MFDFLVVSSERELPQLRDNEFLNKLKDVRHIKTDTTLFWNPPQCPSLTVLLWGTEVLPYKCSDQVTYDGGDLNFFNGWIIPMNGISGPARNIREVLSVIGNGADLNGEFVIVTIDKQGNGTLRRNLFASFQVYTFRTPHFTLIGSRASLVAAFASYGFDPSVDPDFVRWVASYAVCLNKTSLYKRVSILPQGSVVNFRKGRTIIKAPKHDILRDDELTEHYHRDNQGYWDRVFENLISLMKVVDLSEATLDFPLSGGKDSRLLLALLVKTGQKERLKKVFTNGPKTSPEVRSAAMVCEYFDLPHVSIDNSDLTAGSGIVGAPVAHRLTAHLRISEGEISPMDMFWRTNVLNTFVLHGQEAGLRNIAQKRLFRTKEELRHWFMVHLSNGDLCGILTQEAKSTNQNEIDKYIDLVETQGTEYDQVPSRHRIEHRMARWVARTWYGYNSIQFAPYVFMNEAVVLYTYNAGARSRSLEEFHFEMLSRCDGKLLEIPFSGQTWDPDLLAMKSAKFNIASPLEWPESFPVLSRRPTHSIMHDNFDQVIKFICENAGEAVRKVVDLNALEQWQVSSLKSAHIAPFWQLFQMVLFENLTDISQVQLVENKVSESIRFLA